MVRKILYVFVNLLCLILVGLSEFIVAGFDTAIFKSAGYWYSLIASSIANMLILYSTAIKDIDLYHLNDTEVVSKKDEVSRLVNNNVENDFEKFLVEENKKRKIYAWREKINRKINRLEKFTRAKNIELFYSNDEELKKNNRYCQKRAKLEHKLTDEYINTKIYYLRVKYPKLKRYEITMGCRQKNETYKLTTHTNLKVLLDNLPRLIFSISLVLFASSFVPELKDFKIATLITFTIKLLSLCMNILNAKSYATYFKSNTLLPDLQYRIDKITEYMTWKINNKQEVH